MIDIHSKAALLTSIRAADRPIAFLVGSAISTDSSGGVPGVADMLALVHEEVTKKVPTEVMRYSEDLKGATSAEKYQVAMRWLQGNLGQDAVNRVIHRAVLKARSSSADQNFLDDGKPSDWIFPRGVRELAKLVSEKSERFTGPILTTNFDPLLSLAIEGCGVRANIRVLDSDGSTERVVESRVGEMQVVHLHGYWRGSDTLHTEVQLTSPRIKLQASLQKLLRTRTLVVVAYAGWDDVFTDALAALLKDDEASLNILWCFYESDPFVIEARYAKLISRVQPAIIRGRFVAYGGIDCHSIFSEMSCSIGCVASVAAGVPSELPSTAIAVSAPAYTDVVSRNSQNLARVVPRACRLAFVSKGLFENGSEYLATLTLTTDEPSFLSRSVEEIKRQLAHNILIDKPVSPEGKTLSELLHGANTKSRLLDWLATTSFSAHLYFAARAALSNHTIWPESRKASEFIVLPLVHRLSDKSIVVEKLVSEDVRINPFLITALSRIEVEFHRAVPHPKAGNSKRNPDKALLELAELVLECCQGYLLDSKNEAARAIFAHVRTRLKYASRVDTNERHTRSKNPLP